MSIKPSSRTIVPLQVEDLSQFTKSLRAQLLAIAEPPGHSELLNLVSRAAGFRNYQHLRALSISAPRTPAAPDLAKIEKLSRYFDAQGRMISWPSKLAHQELGFWVFWSRVPAGKVISEREISAMLNDWHLFGDHALIRRGMVDSRLLSRTQDGREYRRVERQAPAELRPLLARLAAVAA